jgi:hypothetical protein
LRLQARNIPAIVDLMGHSVSYRVAAGPEYVQANVQIKAREGLTAHGGSVALTSSRQPPDRPSRVEKVYPASVPTAVGWTRDVCRQWATRHLAEGPPMPPM